MVKVWRWSEHVLISSPGISADRCFDNHCQSKTPRLKKNMINKKFNIYIYIFWWEEQRHHSFGPYTKPPRSTSGRLESGICIYMYIYIYIYLLQICLVCLSVCVSLTKSLWNKKLTWVISIYVKNWKKVPTIHVGCFNYRLWLNDTTMG